MRHERRGVQGEACEDAKRPLMPQCLNASCLMPHASYLTPHASCLMPHALHRLMPHASRLMPHASRLMPHASCLTPHASCLMPHASCPMPHAPCLMPLTPASSLNIARVATVGIDFGARRIGVAVSDSGEIATPHSVVRNEGDVIAKIANLGEQLGADLYVVGIARDGRRFKDFAERLRQRTCKEVVLWDEALTTVEAAEQLRAAGLKRRDAEREIDMQAATVILQSYLDAQDRRVS